MYMERKVLEEMAVLVQGDEAAVVRVQERLASVGVKTGDVATTETVSVEALLAQGYWRTRPPANAAVWQVVAVATAALVGALMAVRRS